MNTGAVIKTMNKSGININVQVPSQLDQLTEMNRIRDTELSDPIDAIPAITCKNNNTLFTA